MALLTGMTPDGQEVPVQVDSSGRLVAEGLTGPQGAQGPKGDQGGPGQLGGTAAAPSIAPPNDSSTGLYSPGPGQVAISTGGSGRLFVDASGRVGVGASPTSLFSVRGNAPAINIDDELNTSSKIVFRPAVLSYAERGGFSINYSTGEFRQFCGASAQGYFQTFYVDGSERLRITSAGLVGVGTSIPGSTLHLYGAPAELRIESSTASDGYARFVNTSGSMSVGMSGAAQNIFLLADRLNGHAAYQYAGGASGSHAWHINNTERARIDSSGRLLVGTSTAPDGAPAGSVAATGGLYLKSPNGSWWSLQVSDAGALSAVAV